MSMQMERQMLKGELADLKMKKMELEASIDANVSACKMLLARAGFKPIAEIDLKGASIHLNEALAQKERLEQIITDIAKIEKELG